MLKWIVAVVGIVVSIVVTFGMWCALKVGSDYDDEMDELMKEGEAHGSKGISEAVAETGLDDQKQND